MVDNLALCWGPCERISKFIPKLSLYPAIWLDHGRGSTRQEIWFSLKWRDTRTGRRGWVWCGRAGSAGRRGSFTQYSRCFCWRNKPRLPWARLGGTHGQHWLCVLLLLTRLVSSRHYPPHWGKMYVLKRMKTRNIYGALFAQLARFIQLLLEL